MCESFAQFEAFRRQAEGCRTQPERDTLVKRSGEDKPPEPQVTPGFPDWILEQLLIEIRLVHHEGGF